MMDSLTAGADQPQRRHGIGLLLLLGGDLDILLQLQQVLQAAALHQLLPRRPDLVVVSRAAVRRRGGTSGSVVGVDGTRSTAHRFDRVCKLVLLLVIHTVVTLT